MAKVLIFTTQGLETRRRWQRQLSKEQERLMLMCA